MHHSLMTFYFSPFLDGGPKDNCAILIPSWEKWQDRECTYKQPFQCACEKQGQIYLKLRGLCPESSIDVFWTLQNKEGTVHFYGIKNSEMHYDFENRRWQIDVIGKKPQTFGISEISFHSFLLGRSYWIIQNDSGCNYY